MLPSVLADPRRRGLYLLLVVTGLGQSASMLMLVIMARTYLSQSAPVMTVSAFTVGLLGVLLLALGRFTERYFAEKLAQHYILGLRQQIFHHALYLDGAGRKNLNRGGSLLRLTGDMSAIRNWIVQGAAPLLVLGTWLVVSLLALTLLNPLLLLSLLPAILIAVVGNYLLGRRLYRFSETTRRRKTQLIRNATEKLRTVALVQSFNQQGREERRFQRQGNRLFQSQLDRARLSGILRGFNEAVLGLAMLLLLVTGLQLNRAGELSLAELSLLLGASLYLLAHLRRLGRLYEFWTLKQVAVHKLEQFFAQRSLERSGKGRSPGRGFAVRLNQFACDERFAPLTAEIDKHARIVIRGESGSGKSSLLMALAGLLKHHSGEICLNNRSLAKLSHREWARRVALVSPALPLLRGTLKKNLFYGVRRPDPAFTRQVLQLCGLADWVEAQPAGWKTSIEEGADNLSSNLVFRLLLARALLRRPKLLMIDQHQASADEDIQKILIRLWQWFPGALLLVNAPELLQQSGQLWHLSAERISVTGQVPRQADTDKRMGNGP